MDVQDALDEIGGCRRWHVFGFLLLTLGSYTPFTIQQYGIVFTGWAPPHHCKDQLQYPVNESSYEEQCYEAVNRNNSNKIQPCSNGWTFESNGFSTLVTEFGLICGKDYYIDTSTMIMMLVGSTTSVFGSYLTDRFGRKKVHLVTFLLTAVFGIAASFPKDFWTFVVLKCIIAATSGASTGSGTTLMFEVFGPNTRTNPGIGLEFIWSIAFLIPCLLGFMCRNWRTYQLVGSIGPLVLLPGYWFIFESPTWLYAKKRYKETEVIIEKIIKLNGLKQSDTNITLRKHEDDKVEMPTIHETDGLNGLNNTAVEKKVVIENVKLDGKEQIDNTDSVPIKDLFFDSKLRRHLFLSSFFFFTSELVYVGLTLSSASFGPNRFLNYLLFGVIEFPSTAAALLLVHKFGRKIPQSVLFIFAGIPLLVIGLLPQKPAYETIILCLAIAAKFGIMSAYGVVFLYTRELFPTTLRDSGIAWSFIGGGLGTAMSPLATYLAKKMFWLPNVMFAVVSILAAIAVIPLPETSGKPLPQTTHDVHVILYGEQRLQKQKHKI